MCSVERGLTAFAKSIYPHQPAQSALASMGRNFSLRFHGPNLLSALPWAETFRCASMGRNFPLGFYGPRFLAALPLVETFLCTSMGLNFSLFLNFLHDAVDCLRKKIWINNKLMVCLVSWIREMH